MPHACTWESTDIFTRRRKGKPKYGLLSKEKGSSNIKRKKSLIRRKKPIGIKKASHMEKKYFF